MEIIMKLIQIVTLMGLVIVINCDLYSNSIRRKQDLHNIKNAPQPSQVLNALRRQAMAKEKERDKVAEINRNFEKMIQLVNIMGQVDSFLSDRTKTFIKKMAMLADADDGRFERDFDRRYYSGL